MNKEQQTAAEALAGPSPIGRRPVGCGRGSLYSSRPHRRERFHCRTTTNPMTPTKRPRSLRVVIRHGRPSRADRQGLLLSRHPRLRRVAVQFTAGVPGRLCNLLFQAEVRRQRPRSLGPRSRMTRATIRSVGRVGPGGSFAVVTLGGADVSTAAYTIKSPSPATATASQMWEVGSDFYSAITYVAENGWCRDTPTAASARVMW